MLMLINLNAKSNDQINTHLAKDRLIICKCVFCVALHDKQWFALFMVELPALLLAQICSGQTWSGYFIGHNFSTMSFQISWRHSSRGVHASLYTGEYIRCYKVRIVGIKPCIVFLQRPTFVDDLIVVVFVLVSNHQEIVG